MVQTCDAVWFGEGNPNRGGSRARYSATKMRTTVENLAIAVTDVVRPETTGGRIRAIRELIEAALGLPKLLYQGALTMTHLTGFA